MVIYHVTWSYSNNLAKGKGKITKKEIVVLTSVLCRNSKDALLAFQWHFDNVFISDNKHGLSIDDGVLTLSRIVVDSRNFTATYLYMDGIKQPLMLNDLKGSLITYARHFKF